MEYEKLKAAAETITMSDEMKQRMIRNCTNEILKSRKEIVMKKNKSNTIFRKPAIAFASMAICLSLSVTALATTDAGKGFFKDITNWYGAVVGTSYEQATDEISINVIVEGNEMTVLTNFVDCKKMPYSEVEKLGIAEYKIVDKDGKVLKEGMTETNKIVNGQVSVNIPLNDVNNGSYNLIVTKFISEKKADQPLSIEGNWECSFTK